MADVKRSASRMLVFGGAVFGGLAILFVIWKVRSLDGPRENFRHVCAEHASDINAQGESLLCNSLQGQFFVAQEPFRVLKASEVNGETFPGDADIEIRLYQDPREFARLGYCYHVFNSQLDGETEFLDLSQFYRQISVLRIEAKDSGAAYKAWLAKIPGRQCRARLSSRWRDLEPEISLPSTKQRRLHFFPISSPTVSTAGANVLASLVPELNRLRLERWLEACEDIREAAANEWRALPERERVKYRALHPGLDWSDEELAGSEFVLRRDHKDLRKWEKLAEACASAGLI